MNDKYGCLAAFASMLISVAPAFAYTSDGANTRPASHYKTFDGRAHWYGGSFHGKRTASGAIFDKHKLTCAHPNLPFGTKVRVHSLYSNKDVIVTVTDRCPALKVRCIDLSEGAARKLGIYPYAPCKVHCTVLGKGKVIEEAQAVEPVETPTVARNTDAQ